MLTRVGWDLLRVLTGRLVLRSRKRVDIVFARTKEANAFLEGLGGKDHAVPVGLCNLLVRFGEDTLRSPIVRGVLGNCVSCLSGS
jgi:hypothetical protein